MALKVFRVLPDYSYSSIEMDDKNHFFKCSKGLGDVKRIRDIWDENLLFYIKDPVNTTEGEFYNFYPGVLVFNNQVRDSSLGEIMNHSGEELAAKLDDGKKDLTFLNCISSYNCLDKEKSKLLYTFVDGEKHITGVSEYSFLPNRFGDSCLFKIPENYRTNLFVVTGEGEKEDDFYYQYHKQGFTGLKFEEIWSDT